MPRPTLPDAAAELREMLSRISETMTDDDRLALRDALNQFMATLPWDSEFDELRALANETFDDLGRQVTRAALDRLRERRTRLARHVDALESVTNRANADAKSLRLELLAKFTAASAEALADLQTIRDAIRDENYQAAAARVDAVIARLIELQRTMAA